MKKILHISVIIILALVIVSLINVINMTFYNLPDNAVETGRFRRMDINEKSILKADELAEKENVDKSRLLAAHFLMKDFKLNMDAFSVNEFKQLDTNYKKVDNEEYAKVCKAMSAIFDDLRYFPVAKSSISDYWINYEDSFGADRNYNGAYKHEGTDLMAQNNVSGYYPIVSMTDGVVENMGWLEKGGYRVGIRGNSGGYFYYAHLSSYSNIKKGDKIRAGTLLGYMGDTGYGKAEGTSGNFDVHLHLGIYIKTENYQELSVNPYHILKYLENKLIIANY